MMNALFGLVLLGTNILLIIGLIKPAKVLIWSRSPTRIKVLGWWLLSTFTYVIFAAILSPEPDKLKEVQTLVSQQNYADARNLLRRIDDGDSQYERLDSLRKVVDSLYHLQIHEEEARERNERIASLKREIASIDKGIDYSSYRGSVEEMQMELILFAAWTKVISEGRQHDDKRINSLARQLDQKVKREQKREFPILRKRYAQVVNQMLWENNIEVFASGRGNEHLVITGGLFANNKNKSDVHNQLKDALWMFRFQKVVYRWYGADRNPTYWTVFVGNDADSYVLEN